MTAEMFIYISVWRTAWGKLTLYFVKTSFVKPYLNTPERREISRRADTWALSLYVLLSPQVDYVVLVVSSVEVNVARIDQQEGKQDEEDLDGVFAAVHKVSIKNVGLL